MPTQTPYGDLVRFRSELPKHVLEAVVKIRALWKSAPTDEENCEYCFSIMDGEMRDGLEQCEHYERMHEVWETESKEILPSLTNEEQALLMQDERLSSAATSAEWRASIGATKAMGEDPNKGIYYLWSTLSEGYYAVPDPRAGVSEMTYWYRGIKGRKRRRQVFDPWPAKARYGPRLTWDDVPYERGSEDAKHYILALSETVSGPYRAAIVEAIASDPVAAQQRFADLTNHCCCCGKALTNELAKVYGIGPECRKGMSQEVLANYYRPGVGRAHFEAARREA